MEFISYINLGLGKKEFFEFLKMEFKNDKMEKITVERELSELFEITLRLEDELNSILIDSE